MAKQYTKIVEQHFKDNIGKKLGVMGISERLGLTQAQVRNAVSYARRKGMNIEVVTPGKFWRYGAVVEAASGDTGAREARRVARSGYENPAARAIRTRKVPTVLPGGNIVKTQAPDFTARRPDNPMAAPDWAEAEQAFTKDSARERISFELIGTSTEGHRLVKDNGGDVFKVVPV